MVNAAPILQDLSLSGWGWMEGLSFRADVRGRTQLGSDGFTYPRANDHFNVLDAYAVLWSALRVAAGCFDPLGDGAVDSAGLLMRIAV